MFFLYQIFLLISHFVLDYGYFLTPNMLAAKDKGKDLKPIMFHALIHTAGVSILVAIFCHNFWAVFLAAIIEFGSHLFIDAMKGRLSTKFPVLKDHTNPLFWHFFALDQFLHVVVMVAISNLTILV